MWKKLAYLTLNIKNKKKVLKDTYHKIPVNCIIINNFIAIYDQELYALPVGYKVLGKSVPEKDLLGICYLLVKYMKSREIKRSEDMEIFGLLISLTNNCGSLYYLNDHVLSAFEEKVLRKLEGGNG